MNALELLIKIIADASGMAAGFGDAEKQVKGFNERLTAAVQQMGSTLLQFFGAGAIANAVKSTIAEADELNTRLEGLAVKINNIQPAAGATSASLYAMANQLAEGTQFIDDEVVAALDGAIVKTRDYGAAVRVTQDAMKLATLANIPLEQATKMLALAYEGNTRGMAFLARQMGLNIKDGETYASIMAKINEQSAGLGAVMENSVAVQLKKIGDQFKDVFVEIVRPNIPVIAAGMRMLGVVIEKLAQYIKLMGDYWTAAFVNIAADAVALWDLMHGKITVKDFITQIGDNAKQTAVQLKDDLTALLGFKREAEKPIVMPDVGHDPRGGGGFSDAQMKEYHDFWTKQDKARDARIKADVAQHKKLLQNKRELDEWYYGELEKLDKETWAEVERDQEASAAAMNEAIGNIVADGLGKLGDALFDGAQDWDAWMKSALRAILQVIFELTVLKALKDALSATGAAGGPLGFLSGMFSAGAGKAPTVTPGGLGAGQLVVEMHTADPSSYLKFHSRAVRTAATPGQLADMKRAVDRGAIIDRGR